MCGKKLPHLYLEKLLDAKKCRRLIEAINGLNDKKKNDFANFTIQFKKY